MIMLNLNIITINLVPKRQRIIESPLKQLSLEAIKSPSQLKKKHLRNILRVNIN